MRLGLVIAAYRHQQNISIRNFARLLGVSPAALHRFEKGGMIDSPAWLRVLTWLLADSNGVSQSPLRLPADKAKKSKSTT